MRASWDEAQAHHPHRRNHRHLARRLPRTRRNFSKDHAEFAALLAGLLIVPWSSFKTAFDQNRTALLHVLPDRFRLFAESVNVNEGDFFLFFAGLGSFQCAVHGQAELRDRRALRGIAQLRIAREIPG